MGVLDFMGPRFRIDGCPRFRRFVLMGVVDFGVLDFVVDFVVDFVT
jgi:hypothetical protein